MKLSIVIAIAIFAINAASEAFDNDDRCRFLFSGIEAATPNVIDAFYEFKKKTNGTWREYGEHNSFSYTLMPKETGIHRLSWNVKKLPENKSDISDGNLECDVPTSWRLEVTTPIDIVYPAAMHGHKEDLAIYNLMSIAGIYLGRSKFPVEPDQTRIIWHLRQRQVSDDKIADLIRRYNFINEVKIEKPLLVGKNAVQLVAFTLSNERELNDRNGRWLVVDAFDLEAIEAGAFATPESRHDKFLPWYDPTRAEFSSKTPLEAYKNTVLGPIGVASVYDMKEGKFLAEPVASQDKMQMVFDAIAPPVYDFVEKKLPLFVHLVIKQPSDFKLIAFEVSVSGVFNQLWISSLADPSVMGLPSAESLGFSFNDEVN